MFEGGGGPARRSTLVLLQQALESGGVEFTNGDYPGVRLVGAAIGAAGARPKEASTIKKGPHKRS